MSRMPDDPRSFSNSLDASPATLLHVDTATLVGAALRLGRRPMGKLALRRLKENLTWRAGGGDATAEMALRWLAIRAEGTPSRTSGE